MDEITHSASVLDIDSKSTVGGGVEDVYGEDFATEDQLVTPWTVSVASGYSLLRDPRHNKGLAFTENERDAHYLRGLLPPVVLSQQLQEKKLMNSIRQYQLPIQKYMAMMELEERNERLFYKLLIDNVEELLPVVYTPTVGEACQKYGSIFRRPQGLYISLKEKGRVLDVLKNWPERSIQVIVVTDGERILGLGDLGTQGMGIPVGKLSLYTALGGIRPSACLPITIDVGTNNETLLNDEFYIGLRQRRARGQEYSELLHEFMTAVKQIYGEKVLIQFEDFANHNAFELLEKYKTTHLVFNDDIQGNNAYIFPGFGLGVVMSGAIRVHDDMLLAASEALAAQVTDEEYGKGLIYPPFTKIRKISAEIAAKVAAKAYELGLASRLPRPADLVKYAESCMYSPVYRNFR
ncbi:NADP-dependent malic enzyme [Linum perenne]